jgi:hypothetical protein
MAASRTNPGSLRMRLIKRFTSQASILNGVVADQVLVWRAPVALVRHVKLAGYVTPTTNDAW